MARRLPERPRETFVPTFAVRSGTATSPSAQPSLMARMLEALDVRDGDTVLEIGAGTGDNAALLSHRLGSDHVVTVDVDPELVAAARARLRQAGYEPTLVAGDGMTGYPERAPYDRLLATCGAGRAPDAWREQLRPGGVIVVNIGCGIARLVLEADRSATGRFLPGLATFMTARPVPDTVDERSARSRGPRDLWAEREPLLSHWRDAGRPGHERYGLTVAPDGGHSLWLDEPDGVSWQLPDQAPWFMWHPSTNGPSNQSG